MNGVKTLELDNGITKVRILTLAFSTYFNFKTQDGAVIVWHDESIDGTKCADTEPVVRVYASSILVHSHNFV